jgi:GDPmannose 4,6-dehydratase
LATLVTTALVTGAAGPDGVLLCQLLLSSDVRVMGLVRSSNALSDRLRVMAPGVERVRGDLTDRAGLSTLVARLQPDEVYNLAAMSSVAQSWALVDDVMATNTMGVVNLLEVLREHAQLSGRTPRFYQASSSEMFGLPAESPQDEETRFHPRSPYAVSKLAAHHLTINYRESYGMFACSGILYNHESPLREPHFVTRKITRAAAAIALGRQSELVLGDLDVSRDWGSARDYVEAMRLMLAHSEPDDYVVATGRSRTLREFLAVAFAAAGITDWEPYVRSDPALRRPVEVGNLVGDASKAKRVLGWSPRWTFEETIAEMVEADLALLRSQA